MLSLEWRGGRGGVDLLGHCGVYVEELVEVVEIVFEVES